MNAPLIPARFQPPALRTGLVLRPRLLNQLNMGLDGKLTLISAPTGSGKTTLACAWAKKCGRPTAWLGLDDLDNDPLRFLSSCIRAIQVVQSSFGVKLLERLHTSRPDFFSVEPDAFIEALSTEMISPNFRFLLILDDYHLITNPKIQERLQYLLNHQPACLHLTLVSRADPPWPLGRLRASREINEIRAADLRFTPDEAAEFLNQHMGLNLTAGQVTALEARTEGWIAGLQLAALSLQGQKDPQTVINSLVGSHRFIADYLVEEVLEKQRPDIQEFLLQTSVLEPLNAGLCDAVTGRSDSAVILRHLEQNNLFLQPLDQQRNWYRYHHLFAGLLKIRLQQAFPGQIVELQRRACQWHAGQGRQLEALRYALDAGDAPMAEQLMTGNVFQFLNHDETGAALQRLESMPPALPSARPWLEITRAYLLAQSRWDKACQILDDVGNHLKTLPACPETSRLQGHLEAAWCYLYDMQGDVEKTIWHAERAEALLPASEVEIRAMNLTLWGDILSKERHDPKAMPILAQALALSLQTENPSAAMIASAAMSLAHQGAGRLREAHQVCQRALSIAAGYQQRTGQTLYLAAMCYAVLARIYSEWNQPEEALACGFKGLEFGEHLNQKDYEVMCRQYLGFSLMVSGDLIRGRQVFQRTCEMARFISPWVEVITLNLLVDCLLDLENPQDAGLQEALSFFEQTQIDYPPLLEARLLLKTGQPKEALRVVDKTLADSGEAITNLSVRMLIFRTLALQALGDDAAALASLTRALQASETENRQLSFLREGPPMEKLLRLASRQGICPAFTARLLAAMTRRGTDGPHPADDMGPQALSERENEILHLLAAGLDVPEIAARLVVSANTIRTHIKSLYRKLNAHSRHEALLRAQELKLVG